MSGINLVKLLTQYNKSKNIVNNKGKFEENGEKFNKASLELEARFRNVKGHEFMRLYNHYALGVKPETIEDYLYTIDGVTGVNYRRTISTEEDEEYLNEIWISKETSFSEVSLDYEFKIAMSIEEYIHMDIEENEDVYTYNSQVLRYGSKRMKERWEVELDDYPCKLMLTKVRVEDGNSQMRYEVEVEMDEIGVMKSKDLNKFIEATLSVYKILYDTNCIYTINEKRNVIAYINGLSNIDKTDEVSKSILNEARNLKHKDLVWGGIVGNKNYVYNVTDKADGLRCILVVNNIGVWVIAPGYKYSLLKRIDWTKGDYSQYRYDIVGLICEGEDIPVENRLEKLLPKGEAEPLSYIQFFDILSIPNGNVDVRELAHSTRLGHLMHELNEKGTLGIIVEKSLLVYGVKKFYVLDTVDSFFGKVDRALSMKLNYLTDGLIFTPENEEYNPRMNRENVSYDRRILTRYSDICKWKGEITMDLAINEDRLLYSVRGEENILFRGTDLSPYNPNNYERIISKGELEINLDSLVAGTVVEFAYRRGILVPLRVRYDKTTPNPSFVILDNWKYILDPITRETMIGQSTNLMRKYHNKIKRKLFDYISSKGNPTLLDIASGKGGDVTKWKRFSKIVAVEPNVENLMELRKRVTNNDMDDKVKILNTVGQDTEVISKAINEHIGDKADYCSIMLGFSFFWESEESFNALMRTIIDNTKRGIIFLTIDGDSVEQSFFPTFSITKLISPLKIGKDYIDYVRDRVPPIEVNIGHIVNKQSEYLVYIGDLLRYFEQQFLYRADQEEFMNTYEKKLSSMYTYGYLTLDKSIIVPEKREVITSTPQVEEGLEVEEESVEVEDPEGGEEVELELLPEEETIQQLNSEFPKPIVRISSLHDESFLDSYLKAFHKEYQVNEDHTYRRSFIKKFRLDIAKKLSEKGLWAKLGNGILIDELTKLLLSNEKNLKYTVADLQKHFTRDTEIDFIDMLIITDIIGVDVIVMDMYESHLLHSSTTRMDGRNNKVVLLGLTADSHYDLIGEDLAEGIRTIFDIDSDLVKFAMAGIPIEPYFPLESDYYYFYAIIINLPSFLGPNEKGYYIFREFKRISHNEPYHVRLKEIYNVTTKHSLAISRTKVNKQRNTLIDRGFNIVPE